MDERLALAHPMLVRANWDSAVPKIIAGDASNRRYARLSRENGETAILMDAPPSTGEDVRPFVTVADYLSAQGLSAPRILAKDADLGFLLLEDLGDDVFARVLERDPNLETELYEAATDVLVALHARPLIKLETYNADVMTALAALAFDWYQLGAKGKVDSTLRSEFCDAMRSLLLPLDQEPRVVIQRDYHAENLIWLPDRTCVARVGLLDFQDARLGHPAYDLVSVLQDARRDVSPDLEQQMIARYVADRELDMTSFKDAYALLGVQRNLRILGVFSRLSLAYSKPHYVDLIPRVWGLVMRALDAPVCADVSDILKTALPAPTKGILTSLKAQCGTHNIPS
ncbi:MAG: phosphotransferase [Paracoccaceae bacterium]